MIVARRIVAVILAIIFVALYVPILLVFRANDTIGNPRFYVDRLRNADLYNFAYDRAIPAAIDETKSGATNAVLDISSYKANILRVVEAALPRTYLQQQTESSINTILPYMVGDKDSFSLVVPLKERVKAAAAAVKTEIGDKQFFGALYDRMVKELADTATGQAGQVPFALTRAELESTLRAMMPPEWLQAQLQAGIDSVVPYLTKETEHFAIKIDISDRIDALQTIVVNNLKRPENYNSLMNNIGGTALGSGWQEGYRLPVGLQLTPGEISGTMKQVFTLDWYQSIVPNLVRQVFDYLKGSNASLQIVIPLADRKPALSNAIAQLADRKLEAYVNSLPPSTPLQLAQMLANPPVGRLPDSRPLNLSYAQIKQLLRIDIVSQIAPLVSSSIPDAWVFSDSDFGSLVGAGQGGELLTGIRNVIRNGFTFTDDNLRTTLGAGIGSVEKARQYIAEGFVLTQDNLKELMFKDPNGPEAQNFENVRGQLGTARKWKMVLWILPGLVLVAIGFLGGKHWSSRLMWAAGTLLAAAIVVLIATSPASTVLQQQVHEQLAKSADSASAFQALMSSKMDEIGQDAVRAFFSGLQRQAMLLLLTSVVLLVAAIIWYRHEKVQGRRF
ncbi:MAG: hypothetical protein HYX90_05795 [Chloroflexi bacterium]|nr:hypothetical protein [Chloroflexota bacterium]